MLRKHKIGQSTAEYAILIGLIVAVAVAMQTYVKRGLQGRLKDASDDYTTAIKSDENWRFISSAPATTLAPHGQYEPAGLSSQSTQDIVAQTETSKMEKGGKVTRESTRTTTQAAGDNQKYDYTR